MRVRSVVGLLCMLAVGCGGMPDSNVETSSSPLKKKSPLPGGRDRCAARAPSADEQEAIERDLSSAPQGKAATGVVTVPTYFHVVTSSEGVGDVSGLIPAQMQVLNDAFASAGFQFQLVSQDTVTNDEWYFS